MLGDQLIRDPGIAVFELVKNAYDADADTVTVTMKDVDTEDGEIVVEDNGSGMTFATVTGVWLEPGTDVRQRQREGRAARTRKHHRLPLGEKGVGRFAVDKLGKRLTLITRAKGQQEVVLNLDWDELAANDYLDDAVLTVWERSPEVFARTTGTRLEISGLRQPWDRRAVRALRRSMTSICSPFDRPGSFEAELVLEPERGWLRGLLEVEEVKELALFRASGAIVADEVAYAYEFTPLPGMRRLEPRLLSNAHLLQTSGGGSSGDPRLDLSAYRIGEVKLELLIFDREPQVLALGVSDKSGLKEFLDQNGGVRVYRDGIRVYDYGEPGNDWLGLDAARVNVPSRRISNNIVIGAVSLDLATSQDLVEKTNREGFVENEAFEALRAAVQFAVQQVAVERNKDKDRIRALYSSRRQRQPVLDSIDALRARLRKRHMLDDFAPSLDAVERDFVEMRDQLLTAAGAGLSLSVVIHEVEKAVADLDRAVEREAGIEQIRSLTEHLSELVKGIAFLMRRSGRKQESAASLVRHALFNVEYRLNHHDIRLTNAFTQSDDFKVQCVRRLIISTLMNLVDNSIWWLGVAAPKQKRLWIGPVTLDEGPAIVVADNGPGFVDPPEVLTQPFMSRRTDGMGLGLHLASEVMQAQGGRLEFPDPSDVPLPRGMSGAVVALVFKGGR